MMSWQLVHLTLHADNIEYSKLCGNDFTLCSYLNKTSPGNKMKTFFASTFNEFISFAGGRRWILQKRDSSSLITNNWGEVYGVCMCAEKKIDLGFEYSTTLFLASLLVSFVFLDSTPRSVSNENFALHFLHLQEIASIKVLILFDKVSLIRVSAIRNLIERTLQNSTFMNL